MIFFCFVSCLLQRFQHKICTWTINLIEITIFFVMFSITVSMKNKWKISTSLVYVLVIMDNRYNNSNIFFSLFSVFLMTQNFLQFSCFSKKRFKNDLSNFFVSMHRLLGGVRWQVSWGSGILLLFSSCVLTRKIKTGS